MSTPILATKLYIPPQRPNLVRRTRLIERLNEGLQRRLTLISAPAGFGKTTLVSEWLAVCQRPAAWLSLDEGDGDPVRFLTYLVSALQRLAQNAERLAPAVGASVLNALQSPQPPSTESLLTALINEIVAMPDDSSIGSGQRFVLVLDDYHLIDAQPVDDALTFLLDHLPPQMHLVLTTREDPNLPLARYRVRGQLTELRASDLRFSPAEAATFLNQIMSLNLSAEVVAALEKRTEGWIAGLQLAAISMQGKNSPGQKDAARFIRSFSGSHRFVLDYLVEEVLHQQSQSVQDFLLRTSILDRLCGPLCDALLLAPSGAGQETLEALEQANLFIVPLDDERRWYRYHHLFADLLRQRFASSSENEPERIVDLHLRASRWYEGNDLTIEALQHATAAEDYERAAGLLEQAWRSLNRSYQSAALLGWMKALPGELVRTRPVLCVGFAWALLSSGELEAGEARLQDAERWLVSPADTAADKGERQQGPSAKGSNSEMVVMDEAQFRALPATIAAARAYRAQALDDVPGSVEFARLALDLLPEDDHFERGVAAALLGLSYWASGDLESAHHTFADGLENMRVAGNLLAALSGTFVLVGMQMAQGRLRQAVSTFEHALQLATAQGEPVLRGTADLYAGLSELQREQGELEAAARNLQTSKELGEQARLPEMQYRSRAVVMARLQEAQGDLDGALDLLQEAERLYVRGPVPDVRPVSALKARLWIAQGRLAEAQDWARDRGLSANDDLSYLREFEHVTLARLLIAQYRRDRTDGAIHEASELLGRLLAAAEAGRRLGSVIEILILQALAHEAQGDARMALTPLERALALAEPEGYVRIFVVEGLPMAQLLSAAAAQGMMPDFVGKQLAAFGDEVQTSAGNPPLSSVPSDQSLVEPLSQRELEVLQLLAHGLSNREIGERLFLALDTVKGHNRRIYGKLAVKRRTEAVARAHELGLL